MPVNLYETETENLFQDVNGKKFYPIPQEYRPITICYYCGQEVMCYYEDEHERPYCNECIRIK